MRKIKLAYWSVHYLAHAVILKILSCIGSSETLSLKDVKTSLLAKEKYDSENFSDEQAEGLMVRGRIPKKGHCNRSKFRSRSKGKNNKKFCSYCKKKGMKFLNVLN